MEVIMPGFTTHYLFGVNTYKHLKCSDLKKTIRDHHAAYSLGLQGPDLFFYFLPSYTIRKHNIGSIAHTESTGSFLRHLLDSRKLFDVKTHKEQKSKPSINQKNRKMSLDKKIALDKEIALDEKIALDGNMDLKTEDLRIAEAYIAGFLGHYILDTQCHPYIYWKTQFQEKSNQYYGRHMQLETDIDQELLKRLKHCLPSAFRQDASIALSKQERTVIADILSYVYKKTYPRPGVFHATMHAAIYSIQFGTRFFHDPTGKKKRIIERIDKILLGHPMLSTMIPSDTFQGNVDPLNYEKHEWKNPWDPTLVSNDSFLELMEKAQKRYLEVLEELEKLYHGARRGLLKKLGNASYHSGLDTNIPS